MLHKRSATLILAVSLPALAGCVQATRHSNTMVFGTNTSLAARVGQGVNQIPEVSVGYGRQEAVIMPLLANTGDSGGRQGVLSPCSQLVTPTPSPTPTPTPTTLPASNAQPHPCKFVATKTNASGEIVSQDSYSVLASFGANVKARSPGDGTKNAEIGVGIAQYFATGVAAQLLAANGGAAVVSVSQGATESAKSTETGAATAAVTGSKPTPTGSGKSFEAAWGKLLRDVAEANVQDMPRIVQTAVSKANIEGGAARRINNDCATDKDACRKKLDASISAFNTPEFIE